MDERTLKLMRLVEPLGRRLISGRQRAQMLGCDAEQVDAVDLIQLWEGRRKYGFDPLACFYCETPHPDEVTWHLDHAVPLKLGGAHRMGNLVSACVSCNLRKSKKNWEVFRQDERPYRKRVVNRTHGGMHSLREMYYTCADANR